MGEDKSRNTEDDELLCGVIRVKVNGTPSPEVAKFTGNCFHKQNNAYRKSELRFRKIGGRLVAEQKWL